MTSDPVNHTPSAITALTTLQSTPQNFPQISPRSEPPTQRPRHLHLPLVQIQYLRMTDLNPLPPRPIHQCIDSRLLRPPSPPPQLSAQHCRQPQPLSPKAFNEASAKLSQMPTVDKIPPS